MAFTPFVETDQPTMEKFNEKFQQVIGDAVAQGLKIATGNYTGTGSTSKTLNFNFRPKLVLIAERLGNTAYSAPLINPNSYGAVYYVSGLAGQLSLTWGSNSLTFNATHDYIGDGGGALNGNSHLYARDYYYLAIG